MARHYSAKDFLRQMPNALLARYFQARRLFGDLDFSGMKETKPDELFAAWLYLPDSQRNEMDAEFREIFELSCEKGFRWFVIRSHRLAFFRSKITPSRSTDFEYAVATGRFI